MELKTLGIGEGNFPQCTSYRVTELYDFDILQIALSGQAFRFTDANGGPVTQNTTRFCVVARGEYCEIIQSKGYIEIACTGEVGEWLKYFDIIDCDGIEVSVYSDLQSKIWKSQDKPLKEALDFSNGIRILHQEFLETGITFITSCANNIPRITQLISKLCESYGKLITTHIGDYEVSYYAFPGIETLRHITKEELRQLGFGFRASSIVDFVEFYSSLPLNHVPSSKELQLVSGIGPKVADCILLYSFHQLDRVPMDVWMKRFQEQLYFGDFQWEKFDPYQGICQQYLYYYFRNW